MRFHIKIWISGFFWKTQIWKYQAHNPACEQLEAAEQQLFPSKKAGAVKSDNLRSLKFITRPHSLRDITCPTRSHNLYFALYDINSLSIIPLFPFLSFW